MVGQNGSRKFGGEVTETIKWQDMSKEELFMMAKWHESRAEAFKEVVEILTGESIPYAYGASHTDGEMIWQPTKKEP